MLLQTAKILINKAGVVVMCDDMARASMGNHEKSRQAYALHVWWSKSNKEPTGKSFPINDRSDETDLNRYRRVLGLSRGRLK